jgi:hypothetical protein
MKTEVLKQLWKDVYVAAIRAGESTTIACRMADQSLKDYKEQFGQE